MRYLIGITADIYLTEDNVTIARYFRRVGSGFLYSDRRIICLSELVLIPPPLLADYNRYPPVQLNPALPTGHAPEYSVIVSRIIVEINRHAYLVRVRYLSGVRNLAVLEIDEANPFNGFAPPVPPNGLELATEIKTGEAIQVIGSTSSNNNSYGGLEPISVNPGIISRDSYYDPSGWISSECLLLSVAGVYNNQVGSVVLNEFQQVVGMIISAPTGTISLDEAGGPTNSSNSGFIQAGLPHTEISGEGRVAAISVSVITNFICATECEYRWTAVSDVNNGTWESLMIGYLGFGYRHFKTTDYLDNIDFDGSETGTSGYEYPSGGINNNTIPKLVEGIIVTSIAGDITSLPSHLTPGLPQQGTEWFPLSILNSPLLNVIHPGDQILRVGSDNNSLMRISPGDTVNIEFALASEDPKFNERFNENFTAIEYPAFLNYPYYAYHRWGLVPLLPEGFEPSI